MIHISLEGKSPPQEWLQRAHQLTAELEAAPTPEERHQIIDANDAVWRELKDWLLTLSHGKCWFSEAKDVFSHLHVDHFRPKKPARNLDGSLRDGYWWLAFEWTNFRICGSVGNTAKGRYFPLKDGSFAATGANRNIEDEMCYLLDPTRIGDPALLSFNEEGDAIPMPGLNGWQRERAEVTVRLLRLDYQPLADLRRQKWTECRGKIHECQNLMRRIEDGAGAALHAQLDLRIRELADMVRTSEPLTATAIECLLTSGLRWASRIAAGL